MVEAGRARIRRVRLRSYRSIAQCDVKLGALTFLVGPNGSGKSNFLDALRLLAESLNGSFGQALQRRGGNDEVVHRPHDPRGAACTIEVELGLPGGSARYSIEFASMRSSRSELVGITEECVVTPDSGGSVRFRVRGGVVESTEPILPPPDEGRLYLVAAASLPPFRPVFDALREMAFYDFNPEVIKAPQNPDPGGRLFADGGNLASVVERLGTELPDRKGIIEDYLGAVVPGVLGVTGRPLGGYRTLYFKQERDEFDVRSMSDGTIRALALLTAIFQGGTGLVGIEEPETGVHPAAAAALREAILEASRARQVIATSHSPDLLDDPDLPETSIIAVRAANGVTEIGPLDGAGRYALREHLYTAGELLRIDQLMPEVDNTEDGR